MTAMCDVAFLLLSFFILTTKFKPSEAVTVTTPSSVASKVAPDKDVVLISITKDGKAFLAMDDADKREQVLNTLNVTNSLKWTDAELKSIAKLDFFGVPLEQLKQQAVLDKKAQNDKSLPGIPVQDTTNNQMNQWVKAVASVYAGTTLNLLVKGDNESQFPAFKNVMAAFKKNELFKFQMVTSPENVPEGSALWISNKRGGADKAEE
ncbi:biopolymer transport protein ExbD/TolR [Filimonas lacunae]|nr:biopolymer transport protein ExbD/TolR [Filimonas lacunae]